MVALVSSEGATVQPGPFLAKVVTRSAIIEWRKLKPAKAVDQK
jgi:hypothetical protein